MNILFVHQNYPAQFRYLAPRLASDLGWRCAFATRNTKAPDLPGVERVVYRVRSGPTRGNHFCTRSLEAGVGHAHAAYEALKVRPDVKPDVVVAHSGFGSSLFLPYLYDAPVINFFEYFFRPVGQSLGYRREFGMSETDLLRNATANAMTLLDLEKCARGGVRTSPNATFSRRSFS